MATKAIKSKYEERFVGNYGHNTSEQLTRNSRIFFLGKLYKQKRMIWSWSCLEMGISQLALHWPSQLQESLCRLLDISRMHGAERNQLIPPFCPGSPALAFLPKLYPPSQPAQVIPSPQNLFWPAQYKGNFCSGQCDIYQASNWIRNMLVTSQREILLREKIISLKPLVSSPAQSTVWNTSVCAQTHVSVCVCTQACVCVCVCVLTWQHNVYNLSRTSWCHTSGTKQTHLWHLPAWTMSLKHWDFKETKQFQNRVESRHSFLACRLALPPCPPPHIQNGNFQGKEFWTAVVRDHTDFLTSASIQPVSSFLQGMQSESVGST